MARRTATAHHLTRLQAQRLARWPAAKGSPSRVRRPCIQRTCRRFASGQKHPTWLLSCSVAGRRRCFYVAPAAVPALRSACVAASRPGHRDALNVPARDATADPYVLLFPAAATAQLH